MYMQRTTSGAAGNGLYTTVKYMRGASDIGMGNTIIHLRCTTSGAAGSGLGATMNYLRRTTSAAANNGMSTTITPPCSATSFVANLEPHTGARSSVRLCVGPELARCVHNSARLLNRNIFFLTILGKEKNMFPTFTPPPKNHVGGSGRLPMHIFILITTLLGHINTATMKKLDLKHFTSVGATEHVRTP
jgi:hypothetical protein